MQFQGDSSDLGVQVRVKEAAIRKWDDLSDKQKAILQKVWGVITYKWRWQIAMNIPYLAVFILDRTVPAVHQFDMNILSILTSHIPIPAFISSWLGLG